MRKKIQSRVMQLVAGVDPNNLMDSGHIVWLKTDEASALSVLASEDFVFAPFSHEGVDAQLWGSFGHVGDEAVFADGVVLETCSLADMQFYEVLEPTYIAIESEEDQKILRENLKEFVKNGKLTRYWYHPLTICEIAGFSPQTFSMQRSFFDASGLQPWGVPKSIAAIQKEKPELSRSFAFAILLARLLNDSASNCIFDLPESFENNMFPDLLFARKAKDFNCIDMRTGRVYSISSDLYRAVMQCIRPEILKSVEGDKLSETDISRAIDEINKKILKIY